MARPRTVPLLVVVIVSGALAGGCERSNDAVTTTTNAADRPHRLDAGPSSMPSAVGGIDLVPAPYVGRTDDSADLRRAAPGSPRRDGGPP